MADEVKKKGGGMLLMVIRMIVSALIIAAAVTVKLIGGTVHANVGTWFYENYNNSVMTGSSEGIFPFSDPVEVKETSTVAFGVEVKESETQDKKTDP